MSEEFARCEWTYHNPTGNWPRTVAAWGPDGELILTHNRSDDTLSIELCFGYGDYGYGVGHEKIELAYARKFAVALLQAVDKCEEYNAGNG